MPDRAAAAVAIADSTIMRIEKSAMVRLLQQEYQFAERFM
jgi:CRP-like cAMP-binding protein